VCCIKKILAITNGPTKHGLDATVKKTARDYKPLRLQIGHLTVQNFVKEKRAPEISSDRSEETLAGTINSCWWNKLLGSWNKNSILLEQNI
jgi:hypothetical protein